MSFGKLRIFDQLTRTVGLPDSLRSFHFERLANKLFESVHGKELTDVDEVWLAVAEERMNAHRTGRDKGISEEDFFVRIQKELGWK